MTSQDPLPVVIHNADLRLGSPRVLVVDLLRDLRRSRHLAWEMLLRDLKGQHRTSLTGAFISLLPALTTAAWAILFRDAHLINVGNINLPYPFFVLCGMMLWAVFLESLDAPISGVLAEQGLLSKSDVPPEAVTVARLGQVLFNFGVKLLIIVIAAFAYRIHVEWTVIFVPVGLLLLMTFGAAIGLILAPINLLYTDVGKALPVITTFWFFTTPIIYTSPGRGWTSIIMDRLNPVTALLTSTRRLAFGGGPALTHAFLVSSAVALVLLAIGLLFHRVAMPIVIDRANA